MDFVIWGGAAVSLIGVIGIIYCIVMVFKAKRANLSEDEMRSRLKTLVLINMIALFVSVVGLMLVVAGIIFS